MTKAENRVHFGAWCIVSSPLILAFNLSDSQRHDLVWDIITNKEAIQVNQIWDGHPGAQVLHSIGSNAAVEVWTKPLGEGRVAAFFLNTLNSGSQNDTVTVTVSLSSLNISGPFRVRDVWGKKDLPAVASGGSFSTSMGYHASSFVVFVPPTSTWPIPFELAKWMQTKPVVDPDQAAADGAMLRPRPPPPPSREPCQYWLCEESNAGGYSRLNLTGTGIQTHRTISINGDDFGAGKTMPYANGSLSHVPMTLADFINDTLFSDDFLQRLVRKRLVSRIFGGTSTTNILILDLEYPFPWVHPCEYGGLNGTTLAAVVAATRRRVRIIRQVLPHAGVALYSTVGCTDPTALTGYSKAAQLGLFNELTHLVPVVYMGAKTLASKVAFNALNASLALGPTDSSRQLAMLPLFTWLVSRKSGGKFYGCSLSFARLRNEMAAVREWDASQPQPRVAAMVFWTPGDTGVSGPGHACGRNSPEMNYEEWLRRANIVPHSCPHNVTHRDTLH